MADLVTLSEYKAYASITGTGDDTPLGVFISSASTLARRYCDRDESNGFESTSRTEMYDGSGVEYISLREYPVTVITSVTRLYEDGTTEALDSTEYRVDTKNGRLFLLNSRRGRFARDSWQFSDLDEWNPYPRFVESMQNYSVVYTGGYSTIPADLKYAIYRLVDVMYSEVRQSPSFQSINIGEYSVSRAANVNGVQHVCETALAAYRRGVA